MNRSNRLQKIIAPLALGIGLTLGASISAEAYPRRSSSHNNYHRQTFRDIQPFRSLNVTPRYYTPLPSSSRRHRYNNYRDRYNRDYDRHNNHRERRVHRRGFRSSSNGESYDNRNLHSDGYIKIIRIR